MDVAARKMRIRANICAPFLAAVALCASLTPPRPAA
jgi:hypothetical protein